MNKEIKRVFFAFETHSPWPEKLPPGRYLAESDRHMTVAFLGETAYSELEAILPQCPKPDFIIGRGGIFDKCLFLPEKRPPNVVAWHINWLDDDQSLTKYQKTLVSWLADNNFFVKEHGNGFLPHVTLCRKPFDQHQWKKAFTSLPVYIKNLHLYESLGHSQYRPCWSMSLQAPFEELSHTADIAFLVRGQNIDEIYQHARLALAFNFPEIASSMSKNESVSSLDDVIILLNQIVTELDQREGCPFKAVSFHGDITEATDKTLEWEMIVDV